MKAKFTIKRKLNNELILVRRSQNERQYQKLCKYMRNLNNLYYYEVERYGYESQGTVRQKAYNKYKFMNRGAA